MQSVGGNFGVPDYLAKKAMQNVAGHAAIGTGAAAAKEKENKLNKQEEHHESVQLSAAALQDTGNTQAEEQTKQAKQNEQQLARADQDNNKVGQQGAQDSADEAAIGTGAAKTKQKEIRPDDGCGGTSLTTDAMESAAILNEADSTGILDEMAKKLRGKEDAEKSREKGDFDEIARRTGFNRGTDPENTRVFTPKELTPDEIKDILDRDPESILKDVPTQFRATAQMMVAGQMPASQPNKALTELKPEPRIECAALELLPASDHTIMDISVEAPPIPDLSEIKAEA